MGEYISTFKRFGFKDSVFVGPDEKIMFKKLTISRLKANGKSINKLIKTLNEIFETNKFDSLQIKTGLLRNKVIQKDLYVIKNNNDSYTEKYFSSGEVALIRLIDKIINIQNDSIILLDEIEISLYPKVQRNLLNYLKEQSRAKNLYIFISTHSPTLIKSIPYKNIYLLKDNDNTGIIEVINPCYPANILGEIDFYHNRIPDYILFVEDEIAGRVLDEMIKNINNKTNYFKDIPYIEIIPVGGFKETALLANRIINKDFQKSKVSSIYVS